MDYREIKGVKHYVFDSIEEFRDHFRSLDEEIPPIVESWREADEGDWTWSDDGRIVQILARREFKRRPNTKYPYVARYYVRTVVGTFPIRPDTVMDTDFSLHPNRYRMSRKTDQEVHHHIKVKPNLSRREIAFVTLLLCGKSLQEAYEEAFGSSQYWFEKAVALLKLERIQMAINKNIDEIAEKLGINFEYILSKLKLLVEASNSDKVKLGALKELADWLGAKEKTREIMHGQVKMFNPFTMEEIASIEAEKEMIEAPSEEEELDG